jgi:hypothetical protein
MSDRLFFPLAALLALAFVVLAIQPWAERPPSGPVSGGARNPQDVTVARDQLHRFSTGPEGELDLKGVDDRGLTIVRITRMGGDPYNDPQSGPYLVLGEDIEAAMAAREIEVTIEARSTGEFGAAAFEAEYQARPGESSDWRRFDLTPEFAPYSFTWTTPPAGELGYDYFGIRPVAAGKRQTMEVRSVRFHAIGQRERPASAPPRREN